MPTPASRHWGAMPVQHTRQYWQQYASVLSVVGGVLLLMATWPSATAALPFQESVNQECPTCGQLQHEGELYPRSRLQPVVQLQPGVQMQPRVQTQQGGQLHHGAQLQHEGQLQLDEHLQQQQQQQQQPTELQLVGQQQQQQAAEQRTVQMRLLQQVSPSPAPVKAAEYHGSSDPTLLANLHVPVQEVWQASSKLPGFQDVVRDEDQQLLYDLQLEPDIAYWRGRNLTMAAMDRFHASTLLRHRPSFDVFRRFAIIKNKIFYLKPGNDGRDVSTWVLERTCAEPCNLLLIKFGRRMQHFMTKTPFPDCVFQYSVFDNPICRTESSSFHATRPESHTRAMHKCAAPVLVMQKTDAYSDVLVPILDDIRHPLYIFPDELKSAKAFSRATAFCSQPTVHHGFVRCFRTYMARRVKYGNWSGLIEAGLTTGYGSNAHEMAFDLEGVADGPLPALGFFPLRDHVRFKYLLDTDGVVAAYRASKLMHMNSPIFKQETPHYEWYGKLLKEGVHYVGFFKTSKDDLLDTLLHWRGRDAELSNISDAAMRLAYRYTSPTARMLYWRRALTKYKSLFSDMDEFIRGLTIPT